MNGDTITVKKYEKIVNSIHAGLVPSYDFLQRMMTAKDFNILHEKFKLMMDATSNWLKEVEKKINSELSTEGQLGEYVSGDQSEQSAANG